MLTPPFLITLAAIML